MRDDKAGFAKGLQSGGLGYRLVPTSMSWREQLQPGQLLVLDQIWENRNVSLCFHRYLLKFYLTDNQGNVRFSETDSAFDPTSWVKGETHPITSVFHLPGTLPTGEYDVRIALVDEQGQPRVKLGIEGPDAQWRYRLGTLRIIAPGP